MATEDSRFWHTFNRTRSWYGKFERPISSISLIWGFIFDAITLTRVDEFWENFFVVIHLIIVGTAIILINRYENAGSYESDPARIHFWMVNVMQFFFGGLLSVFLVFYFRSGTLAVSWPFLVILAAAFIVNERLKKYYARFSFQIALFFLCIYLFVIYYIPVLFHQISPWIFLLSGGVSLAFLIIFLAILRLVSRERLLALGQAKLRKQRRILFALVLGTLALMNVLYFTNLIPPIPLELKDGNIYHSLTPLGPGNYIVTTESTGWQESILSFFGLNTIQLVSGDRLFAYTSIFSPTSFATEIIHEWQWYDPSSNSWTTLARISLPITGGSSNGWRTYSIMPGIVAGDWRVNVETQSGQVLGRLAFKVVATSTEPALTTETIN